MLRRLVAVLRSRVGNQTITHSGNKNIRRLTYRQSGQPCGCFQRIDTAPTYIKTHVKDQSKPRSETQSHTRSSLNPTQNLNSIEKIHTVHFYFSNESFLSNQSGPCFAFAWYFRQPRNTARWPIEKKTPHKLIMRGQQTCASHPQTHTAVEHDPIDG